MRDNWFHVLRRWWVLYVGEDGVLVVCIVCAQLPVLRFGDVCRRRAAIAPAEALQCERGLMLQIHMVCAQLLMLSCHMCAHGLLHWHVSY